MARNLIALVALVAVGAVAAWLLLADDEAPERAPASIALIGQPAGAADAGPTTPARADTDDASAAPAAAAADPDLAATAPDAAELARLEGTVTTSDGAPVVGARVDVRLAHGQIVEDHSRPVTDASGTYRLALADPGRLEQLVVDPSPRTLRTVLEPDRPLTPRVGEITRLDAICSRGGSITGQVLDEDGRTLARAVVRCASRDPSAGVDDVETARLTRTDERGRFTFDAVGPAVVLAFVARGDGTPALGGEANAEQQTDDIPPATAADEGDLVGVWTVSGELDEDERADELLLRVARARTLRARVVDTYDVPVAGASVTLTPTLDPGLRATGVPDFFREPASPRTLATDADGAITATGFAPEPCHVEVDARGHPHWTGRHTRWGTPILIRLAPGATLTGRVTARLGGAVDRARVLVHARDRSPHDAALGETLTDAAGAFTLDGLPETPDAIVLVHGAGYAIAAVDPVAIELVGTPPVDVLLEPARPIGGVVVDPSGAAVADARVSIRGERVLAYEVPSSPPPTLERQLELAETRTDESGRFRFEDLYDGMFALTVLDADDGTRSITIDVESGREDVRVVLDPRAALGVTLRGRVRDALTGAPVHAFALTPYEFDDGGTGSGRARSFATPDGTFEVSGLRPGVLQVEVTAEGYAPWFGSLQTYGPGEHDLDVHLSATRTLRLRVVDADGYPVPDATISFADAQGAALQVQVDRWITQDVVRTDAGGQAIAAGLPAAVVNATVRRAAGAPGTTFTLDLRVEPQGIVELRLDAPTTIQLDLVVLGGFDTSTEAELAESLDDAVVLLGERMLAGELWPLDVEALVEISRLDGTRVDAVRVAPTGGVFGTIPLTVPAEALRVRVSAPGYRTSERGWSPTDTSREGHWLLVTLPRG